MWGGSDGVDNVVLEVLQHGVANRGSPEDAPLVSQQTAVLVLDVMLSLCFPPAQVHRPFQVFIQAPHVAAVSGKVSLVLPHTSRSGCRYRCLSYFLTRSSKCFRLCCGVFGLELSAFLPNFCPAPPRGHLSLLASRTTRACVVSFLPPGVPHAPPREWLPGTR